ncbi:MAG: hypothetical protein ACREA1_00500, partial [Nitrosotalea sp.]
LIIVSVSFVPVSYLWYNTLSGLDCKESGQSNVVEDSSDVRNTCVSKTSSHWMIFYGINAVVYGMPFALIVKSTRNRSTGDY